MQRETDLPSKLTFFLGLLLEAVSVDILPRSVSPELPEETEPGPHLTEQTFPVNIQSQVITWTHIHKHTCLSRKHATRWYFTQGAGYYLPSKSLGTSHCLSEGAASIWGGALKNILVLRGAVIFLLGDRGSPIFYVHAVTCIFWWKCWGGQVEIFEVQRGHQ